MLLSVLEATNGYQLSVLSTLYQKVLDKARNSVIYRLVFLSFLILSLNYRYNCTEVVDKAWFDLCESPIQQKVW